MVTIGNSKVPAPWLVLLRLYQCGGNGQTAGETALERASSCLSVEAERLSVVGELNPL